MKPHFYKVNTPLQESFTVHHLKSQNFGRIWHYHPELELHYTIKGNGLRFIGDNVTNFNAGEVILLGENLPHSWRCQEEYYTKDPDASIEAIVIQFLPDCMGKDLFSLPEAWLLPQLFEKAKMGMVLYGKARETLIELMLAAVNASGMDRLIILLSMLKTLSSTGEFDPITSAYAFYKSNEVEALRLNTIYNYTLAHFKENISLEDVAAMRNLTVTSFCRYFKMMTNKSYYDFLIEIRISHACRILIEDRHPIDVLCFECGFNNVSNFYRHFKKITGMTPLDYKRKFMRSENRE
ncbi:AraC family transcriptional regulator [Flavitalea flava]